MRFLFLGPRLPFGVRPGISLRPGDFLERQRAGQIEGSFVYVIDGPQGRKIGVSTDPEQRLAQLQTGSSAPLRIVAAWGTQQSGFDIETRAHDLLTAFRLEGEWFSVTPAQAMAAVERAIRDTGALAQRIPVEQIADVVMAARLTSADAVAALERNKRAYRIAGGVGLAVFVVVFASLMIYG